MDLSWLEWRSTLGFIFTKRGDSLGDIGVSFLISRCYVSVFSDWLFSVRRIHHLVPSQVKLVNRGAEKSQAEEHVERSQAVVSEHTTTISGVSQWERKPSRCVSVVWSSCISGGQAWWLQIQVPNYSRSDAIISLSKEMIFYLLEECNPFHDDYFWEDILGGHLQSLESSVMFGCSFRTHSTLQIKLTTFQIKSTGDCNKPWSVCSYWSRDTVLRVLHSIFLRSTSLLSSSAASFLLEFGLPPSRLCRLAVTSKLGGLGVFWW